MLLACNEFALNSIDPDGPPPVVVTQVERFVQEPLPAVDVLFVVDGTASMQQELDALGADVDGLITTLGSLGLDWQLGVVSADVSGPWAGWLLGTPYVITPATPDPSSAFAARLPQNELSGEAGLAAATLALEETEASGANAGFRRVGAQLQVVFVSDADDRSDAVLADPIDDFLDQLALTAGSFGTASALVGDTPAGCSSDNGTAQAGVRYHAASRATSGQTGSICSAGFAAVLADLGAGSYALPNRFQLRVPGGHQNVSVSLDGQNTSSGWVVEGDELVFDVPPPAGALIEVRYVVREDS